jgi:hypothetical protein
VYLPCRTALVIEKVSAAPEARPAAQKTKAPPRRQERV